VSYNPFLTTQRDGDLVALNTTRLGIVLTEFIQGSRGLGLVNTLELTFVSTVSLVYIR